jgi:branched-chain amino acid transport system permease protein
VGGGLEYASFAYGDTPLHLVAVGLLLGVVVMVMPDGVIPAVTGLARRLFRPPAPSIRELSAEQLQDVK